MNKAFTIIELLVIISIVAIIAAIVIPNVASIQKQTSSSYVSDQRFEEVHSEPSPYASQHLSVIKDKNTGVEYLLNSQGGMVKLEPTSR